MQQLGQQLAQMQPIALPLQMGYAAAQAGQQKRCACKKARCLKLYCVCFAAGAGRGPHHPAGASAAAGARRRRALPVSRRMRGCVRPDRMRRANSNSAQLSPAGTRPCGLKPAAPAFPGALQRPGAARAPHRAPWAAPRSLAPTPSAQQPPPTPHPQRPQRPLDPRHVLRRLRLRQVPEHAARQRHRRRAARARAAAQPPVLPAKGAHARAWGGVGQLSYCCVLCEFEPHPACLPLIHAPVPAFRAHRRSTLWRRARWRSTREAAAARRVSTG